MKRWLFAALAAVALVCPAQAQQFPPTPGVYRARTVSAATSATRLDSGSLREYVYIYNNGAATVFVGFDSAVTTSTGWPVKPGTILPLRINVVTSVYGIVASGTVDVRVMEVF